MRSADWQQIREMTESWTGVSLPADVELISGSYLSAFKDPSLSAVFDAGSVAAERFIDSLGPRVVREYAADCAEPPGPVRFAEVPGSGRRLDNGVEPVVLTDDRDTSVAYDLVRLVGDGDLERCRAAVRIDATPRGTIVTVTKQVKTADASRIVLSVVTW